ncbi:LysR family transcriptional regulator [Bacillus sp. ISL-18]|uniref:LysR family transcriptional regulator n=1 Tax=Bacillus sp. ISL-18 TaxID=2819118 RepID=UPI001BEB3F4F|nr:LysR family transcriptional regulator [Bacillus sp. ISL-18]MBT2658448.1 LysR family transcriptional regulator [Bacillus sp. ISL-18]
MSIEQLQYIVEIAKTGSISNAAQNLHISQAAISKAVSNLEEELGVTLFKRSRSGTVPTEESLQLIRKAFEIVIKLQEFREEAQIQTATISGDFKFSAIPSYFMTILPKTFSKFIKEYPEVNVQMSEKETFEILSEVKQNQINFGLIASFEPELLDQEEFLFDILLEGRVQVFVSKNSPLAYCDTVTPQELINETIVAYNGSTINSFINDFFNKYGAMKILFTSNNTEVIKKTVAEGLAIYFNYDLGQSSHHYVVNGDIVPIPLVGHDRTNIFFGLVRSKKKYFSAAAREFIKQLKQQIAKGDY